VAAVVTVLGTALTLANLLSMAASAGGVAADITKVVEGLRAKGHPENAPIPPEAALEVQKALDNSPQPLPADFGALAGSERAQIAAAIQAVRSIYVLDPTVDDYRTGALKALYSMAEYLDQHV